MELWSTHKLEEQEQDWAALTTGFSSSLLSWFFKHPKVAIYNYRPQPPKRWKETIPTRLTGGGLCLQKWLFSLWVLMAKFPSMTIASHQSAMNFSTPYVRFFPASISIPWPLLYRWDWGWCPDVVRMCQLDAGQLGFPSLPLLSSICIAIKWRSLWKWLRIYSSRQQFSWPIACCSK